MSIQVETRPEPVTLKWDGDESLNGNEVPPSDWAPKIHPRAEEVAREVDGYFLEHWNFTDDRARSTFLKAGFSRVTCLYFPLAKDERIHFACRLLTVLFLIDDILEDMSFSDGEKLNNRLIELSKGPEYATPDRSIPAEFVIYDLWESMRAHDLELANEVLEPTFVFMRSQTDKVRLTIKELGEYLRYREKDVGKALLSALMRFSMDLRPTPAELAMLRDPEENCAKHLSIVNDIYSFEKEVLASKTGHAEGSFLCSAVKVLATETGLDVSATKRVLWSMVREWELVHNALQDRLLNADGRCSPTIREYMRGLQFQMSGNELWSRTTPRYMEPVAPGLVLGK
ncbi:Aristolochene synthase from penicillium Roqueforti [Cryphonectria parasitica EP155]|uniref:Terpene synthase n=1 Tax=Cryphonectria parasitica (strain ATCC 38755 / EP155) TaxID=660469 RepID=A0A9P4XT26_CRYP1|nr:Aristolochene synthase from penicillium Roqueforti [Cryphonectria parasitica EP155]KAF3760408.1 Aristolochene synthase from penicillium Roqueforti [Cryphonectria parasitica EP155]